MSDFKHYQLRADQRIMDALNVFENSSRLNTPVGVAVIVDEEERVIGTVTEGDIRRGIVGGKSLDSVIEEIANYDPIVFYEGAPYRDILEAIPEELRRRGRKRAKKYLGKILMVTPDRRLSRVIDYHELWEMRVATHRHIAVIGMGYVGLTLAVVMAEEGYLVSGVDSDEEKIRMLREGKSYVFENGLEGVLQDQVGKNLFPVQEIPEDGDVYIISVGTPVTNVDGKQTPIMQYIEAVSRSIGRNLRRGNLVILRSTVPIGTSREVVKPILEAESGLKCGSDFHLSFAPERTAEGKAIKELRELPQIIGGYNDESTDATAAVFRELTSNIIRVSSLEAAETVKLVNNTFRDLIFAYSNHVTQIASHFNIDISEVIKAANQGYPRDPVPLPSPGVGGPCLTKDPHIFANVAEYILEDDTTLFRKGRLVNESMHQFVVQRLEAQLQALGKSMADSKILVCGLAFKGHPETGDVRNSSAVEIHHLLKARGAQLFGHDPVANLRDVLEQGIEAVELYEGLAGMDAVLFLNNHRYYEKLNVAKIMEQLAERPIIFDGWNLFSGEEFLSIAPCVYMGLSSTKNSIEAYESTRSYPSPGRIQGRQKQEY